MDLQDASADQLMSWVSNGIEAKKASVERGLQPSNWLWPLANDADSILRRCAADTVLLNLHAGRGHSCPAYDADGDLDENARFYDHEACPVLQQLAEGYGWSRTGGQIECGWHPLDGTADCGWDQSCPTHGSGGVQTDASRVERAG